MSRPENSAAQVSLALFIRIALCQTFRLPGNSANWDEKSTASRRHGRPYWIAVLCYVKFCVLPVDCQESPTWIHILFSSSVPLLTVAQQGPIFDCGCFEVCVVTGFDYITNWSASTNQLSQLSWLSTCTLTLSLAAGLCCGFSGLVGVHIYIVYSLISGSLHWHQLIT